MTQDLWYALKVRPRFERTVVMHLRSRGYDPFLPTYVANRQWSDRVKSVELPLFPGYLFCQIDLRSRLPILTTPGVNFIVGIKGKSFSVAELENAGVRRISLATSLFRSAMTGLVEAAREVKERGTFTYLDRSLATPDLNRYMQE